MLRHRKGQPSDGENSLWWIVEHTFIYMGRRGASSGGEQPITWGGESTKSPPLPPIIFISSDINIANHMSQNEGGSSNRKRTLIISDSIMTNIEWWRLDKRMKSNVAVKLNRDPTTTRMKRNVRGCLEENSVTQLLFTTEPITWKIMKMQNIFNWYNEPGNICKKQKENCSSLWYNCRTWQIYRQRWECE